MKKYFPRDAHTLGVALPLGICRLYGEGNGFPI